MKRKLMLLLTCLFIGIGLVTAQNQKITGVVLSEDDGQPVVGASILVKGTTMGTVTDLDGKFALSVPSSAKTLVISYIGMQTHEVGIKSYLKVTLKSNAQVTDEVVVVAYGTAKKASLTGALSSVKSSDLDKVPVTSFEKALQGLSSGLQVSSVSGQPGSVTQVRLRGIGSMSASSSPLYVIDGVAIESKNLSKVANEDDYGTSANPLSSLNPNDIESVTILKDASAASLYGSRAANGVILITTKQGTKGKSKVSFKAQASFSKLPSDGYDLMSASDHYSLYYGGFYSQNIAKGMTEIAASNAANTSTIGVYGRNPYNVSNPIDAKGHLVSGAKLMIDTDWMDELFRTGKSQEYDLGINGGNDNTKYFLSLGYLTQDGTAISSGFERYSGRANVSSQIRPWFSAGINSTFSLSKQNTPVANGGGASPLTNAMYVPNTVPVYNLDANFDKQYDANGKVLYNFKNPVFKDMNAVSFAQTDIYNTNTYRALVNPYVEFNIARVHWKNSLSYDYINLDETRWYNAEHGNGAAAKGRLSKYGIWNLTAAFTSTLNYNFTFNNDHNFSAMAGYEATKNEYKMTSAMGTNFPAGGLIELNVAATPQEVGSKRDIESMVSYFGRMNYDYLNKYFASFSIRSDGSSRFAPGHQYGTFWSAGLNWRINEEFFLKDVKWVNDLKLRASYGTSGNKSSDYLYGYQGLYGSGNNYNGQVGITHNQLPNSDLSWEKANNFNVGVDFSFFNCLNGSVEYYLKKSSALLLEKPLAGSTGLDKIISNLGGMKNSGIEFELHSTNLQLKNFTWNTDFNISYNKNKITSYPQKEEVVDTKIRTVGYSLYEFYMQEWAGIDKATGAPLWYKDVKDANNNPTGARETTSDYSKAGRYKCGSSLADVFGGLNNTLSYKGVDLSFMFTYRFGGKIYDGYEAYLLSDGNKAGYQAIKEQADYWTPTNTSSKNPKFQPNNTSGSNKTSSRYLHDADFIKMKNISLGYKLPTNWIKKVQLENVRVFGSLENVFTFNLDKNFKGYDVELGGVTGVLDGGGTIPLARTVLFGVNISF
jgi:TonB-linked SusC/RagA family outer membrane protein